MKQTGVLLMLLLLSVVVNAQTPDTIAPYLKEPVIIPPFNITLANNTSFSKKDLPKNKFIVITYFNPECGHCQLEAQMLAENMNKFHKAFFVMAAYKEMELITEFAETYQLNRFKNIRIGRDDTYFLPVYYQVKTTPFTAVYNKKGKLLKAFADGYTIADLEKLVK